MRKWQPFAVPAGGPIQASAPTQGGSSTIIRLPCLPFPVPAARLPCDVGRAFTPAGEAGGGGPERYWQGKAPHPSVG